MSDWEEDMYDDDEEEEELSFEDEDEDNVMDYDDNSNNKNDDDNLDDYRNNRMIDSQSLYFQAKNFKEEDNYAKALELFNIIVDSNEINENNNEELSNYRFKSIKQSIKIYEHEKNIDFIINYLDKLFRMKTDKFITTSYFNSSIFKIISRIDRENYEPQFSLVIFNQILSYLSNFSNLDKDELSNKKLKIKIQLLISNCYLETNDKNNAEKYLITLEQEVINSNNELIKNTYYLEILAMKILLILNDNNKIIDNNNSSLLNLRRLTNMANKLISGIPQSKILGIINEGSGVVAMYSNDFLTANTFFQNSFKCFNDCGDKRRIEVLIKFILSSLLSKSEVNPFNSSDYQGFFKLKQIKILIDIYNLFQIINNESLAKFNKLINSNEFIKLIEDFKIVNDFKKKIIELYFINYIINELPFFEKVKFEYFTKKLKISDIEMEELLIKILNKGLLSNFKIDLVDKYIIKISNNTFIDITQHQLIENSFKYYKLDNFNRFEDMKNQIKLIHKSENEKSENELNDFPELMELTFDNLNNTYLNNNKNHKDYNDKSLINTINEHNINIPKLKFNTIYNNEMLQKLSLLLNNDNILNKDLKNDIQIDSKLILNIEQYIDLIKNSLPVNNNKNLSYFDKIKDEKIKNEFNKLFNYNNEIKYNKAYNDDNIPDVIQTTVMNQLEIPVNPDKDKENNLSLKGKEKKIARLKAIQRSIQIITDKNREFRIRNCNLCVKEEYDEVNDDEDTKENYEELGHSNNSNNINIGTNAIKEEFGVNRMMIHRLINRQINIHSADQSETTSIGDNMSFDGSEDYREDY